MEKHRIPGVAVGLVLDDQTYIFNFGLASKESHRPVTDTTIFEVGSISKTFTATLATYAESMGKLKLSDSVSDHLPELANTEFGKLQLYHLGTHTAGGLPLQLPDEIQDEDGLRRYLRNWKPRHMTGAVRTYANPSIGMLGVIAARSMQQDFTAVVTREIFQSLGMTSTYYTVPADEWHDYAHGYTKDLAAVRLQPGMLANEAYGVKTTARDLTRYLKANMGMLQPGSTLQTALNNTHKTYFKVGDMMQALIWEDYALPAGMQVIQKGNSRDVIFNPVPVVAQHPPADPGPDVWVNKTGSTNGFGAYLAFVPAKRFGIVLLANKHFPNEERVELAYRIFEALSRKQAPD